MSVTATVRARPGALLVLLFAAALAPAAALLLLVPDRSQAAECRGASKPAFQMSSKRASKLTVCLLNRERQSRGLSSLKSHRAQRKAAKRHSRAMVKKRCFSHQCAGEKDLVGRVHESGYLPCGCAWSVAENIAYGHGRKSSPRKVVARWMGSAGHRANVLNPAFEHVGVGVKPGSPTGRRAAATYTANFGFKR